MRHHHSILLLVVWGALAFGAVYPWAYWPLAAGCTLVGAYGLRAGAPAGGWLSALTAGLVAIGVGVVIQLVPLPRPWLLTVGRATDRFLREFTLGYEASPPAWHSLSIAPASTLQALALFAALAVLLIGLIRMLPRMNLEPLVHGLMVFGVLFALFGIIQKALFGPGTGPHFIYGFWRPVSGGSPFGSFVNPNHFAGWMLMALPVVLGYAFGLLDQSRPRRQGLREWIRWTTAPKAGAFMLAALCVLVMGTSLVATRSRAGIGAFAVAVLVAAGFVLREVSGKATRMLVATGACALLVSAIAWGGINTTVMRFSAAPADIEGRLTAWRDTVRIARDFAYVGTGLNTYGTAMLIYQTGDRRRFYREAHNDYLQLAAEGGILLGVPIVMTLAVFTREAWRRLRHRRDDRMRHWIRVGSAAGIAGIAAQSLFDFSLQMPGNAVLFTLLAAIAVHQPGTPNR